MKKSFIQGLIIVFLFFATWIGLSELDWMTIFQVKKVQQSTEQKLGDLFWNIYEKSQNELKSRKILAPIDSLLDKICISNKIDRAKIKLHILQSDEVNAFALPDNHLVIYSGLILASENEAELSGVMCHELAHLELNHVMKKLVKEIGLSTLISMTTGNGSGEIIKKATKILSSSAFDRKLEKDADIKAVDYLVAAGIDPEQFANFLFRLSEVEAKMPDGFSWISTHPESKERSEYIISHSSRKSHKYKAILAESTWLKLKEQL